MLEKQMIGVPKKVFGGNIDGGAGSGLDSTSIELGTFEGGSYYYLVLRDAVRHILALEVIHDLVDEGVEIIDQGRGANRKISPGNTGDLILRDKQLTLKATDKADVTLNGSKAIFLPNTGNPLA